MSWYKAWTASALDSSLNSLYMLCVPDRESYRSQMPKFLTFNGFFSEIYSKNDTPKCMNFCQNHPFTPTPSN